MVCLGRDTHAVRQGGGWPCPECPHQNEAGPERRPACQKPMWGRGKKEVGKEDAGLVVPAALMGSPLSGGSQLRRAVLAAPAGPLSVLRAQDAHRRAQ